MQKWQTLYSGAEEECESLCSFLAEHSVRVLKVTDEGATPNLSNRRGHVTLVQVPEEDWERAAQLIPSWTTRQQVPVNDLTSKLSQAFLVSASIPAGWAVAIYVSPQISLERHGFYLVASWILGFVLLARRLR